MHRHMEQGALPNMGSMLENSMLSGEASDFRIASCGGHVFSLLAGHGGRRVGNGCCNQESYPARHAASSAAEGSSAQVGPASMADHVPTRLQHGGKSAERSMLAPASLVSSCTRRIVRCTRLIAYCTRRRAHPARGIAASSTHPHTHTYVCIPAN